MINVIFVNELNFKNLSGIYCIRNIDTDFIYVGQTKQPFEKRFMHHRWQLRNNKHDNRYLQNSFNKHGEDSFAFEVIEVIDKNNHEEMNEREMFYIDKFREEKRCYNISDGGDGAKGVPMSDRNRKFFSELNRRLNTGKKASQKTKEKMSASRKKYYSENPVSELRGIKAYKTREKTIRSGNCKCCTITFDDVVEIKKLLVAGAKQADIAKKFGVHQTNISAINNEVSWSFVKVDGWEYRTIKKKPSRKSILCQASDRGRSND